MELFERNYKAVVNRGLIKNNTTDFKFYSKLKEESKEVFAEMVNQNDQGINEEVADCLVVCANWLIFRGVNIDEMLIKIAEKNEKRANQKAPTN
jgi:phosphoribosyl-ATP pyrophosphohydrolase